MGNPAILASVTIPAYAASPSQTCPTITLNDSAKEKTLIANLTYGVITAGTTVAIGKPYRIDPATIDTSIWQITNNNLLTYTGEDISAPIALTFKYLRDTVDEHYTVDASLVPGIITEAKALEFNTLSVEVNNSWRKYINNGSSYTYKNTVKENILANQELFINYWNNAIGEPIRLAKNWVTAASVRDNGGTGTTTLDVLDADGNILQTYKFAKFSGGFGSSGSSGTQARLAITVPHPTQKCVTFIRSKTPEQAG